MTDIPTGFSPSNFTSGFLGVSGPYYIRARQNGSSDDSAKSCADDRLAGGIIGQRLSETHMNYVGIAHGGVLATLADVAMYYLIHDCTRPRLAMVTNSRTTNFLAGAKLGDWLEADAKIDRMTKRIAYTSAEIRCGTNLLMTATGVFTIIRKS